MLTWGTDEFQRLSFLCGVFPFFLIPPVHLSDMFVLGEIARKPFFITQRDKVRNVWTKLGNGVDVKMVIMRTKINKLL